MNLNTGGWASAAQRFIARLRSENPNHLTPVTEINGGTISATNADIALVAKGTGATLAQVPDGTIAGGNKRGARATDLQKLRNAATQIAQGSDCVIAGGFNNTASSDYSSIGGGGGNTASSFYSTIAGGDGNTASGSRSFVGGGQTNIASGNRAVIAGGNTNTASSDYSFIGGGQSNTAQTNTHATVCGGSTNTASGQWAFVGGGVQNNAGAAGAVVAGGNTSTASGQYSFVGCGSSNNALGDYAVVVGGLNNTANAIHSAVLGGRQGTTRNIIGNSVIAACSIPISNFGGATQSALLLLGRQTTDATATVLTSNTSAASTTNQVILPNNSAYYFRGSVISGVTGGGDSKAWTFEGAIKRGATAASTTIVGTVVVNVIAFDAGASAWTIAVTADTTNGGLAVTFTGAAATTIRTVAKIETTEMTY